MYWVDCSSNLGGNIFYFSRNGTSKQSITCSGKYFRVSSTFKTPIFKNIALLGFHMHTFSTDTVVVVQGHSQFFESCDSLFTCAILGKIKIFKKLPFS